MKKMMMIAMLCCTAATGFAQFQYTTKDNPPLKNNGERVYVTPAFDDKYRVVSDSPCYMYKRHGIVVLECPGVVFIPETGDNCEGPTGVALQDNGTFRIENTNVCTGGHSTETFKVNYEMPAGATPVYPASPHTPLVQGAPCYEYATKSGLVVMECPGLIFPAERKKTME